MKCNIKLIQEVVGEAHDNLNVGGNVVSAKPIKAAINFVRCAASTMRRTFFLN